MIEFIDFTKPAIIDEYLSYWENEYRSWDNLVKERAGALSAEQMLRYDKIKMIYQNYGRLTDWIIDMNALTPQMLSADNFAVVKKAIIKQATANNISLLQPEPLPGPPNDKDNVPPQRFMTRPLLRIVVLLVIAIAIIMITISWPANRPAAGSTPSISLPDNTIAKDSNGRDTFHLDNSGERTVKKNEKKKDAVIKAPDDDKAPSVKPDVVEHCEAICHTKGMIGIEVSFVDEKNSKRYSQRSDGQDLVFKIPCSLKGKPMRINFTGNGLSDYRNMILSDFEIPELFKARQ